MGEGPDPTAAPAPALPGLESNPLDSVMPVLLFIGVNRFVTLGWAIAAATVWSAKVAITRKRRGSPIGKFLPIITLGIVARGLVGILTDSEAVYFGIGIGTKAAIGIGVIATMLVGHNLLARYAPLVFGFDDATVADPLYASGFRTIAWAVGLAELSSAAFDVWLFNNSSVNYYLVVRFFVNWPLTTIVMFGSLAYLGRKLAHIEGFPGLNHLIEVRMAEYEDAVRRRRRRPADSS
jgi:hypothetical protein